MKLILALVIVLALAILLWAVVLYFRNWHDVRQADQTPWLDDLTQLKNLQGGPVQPSHLAGMAYAVARSLEKLPEKIERSNVSAERLGRINLVLTWTIAVATMSYAVAAWLQLDGVLRAR